MIFYTKYMPLGIRPAAPLAALIVFCSIAAPAATGALPDSSERHGIVKRQRIRFENAPLFKKADAAVVRNDCAAATGFYE
ncbi:MAG: hypothetical protein WC299_11605, partial [Kiritimatiellia bacterium]